MSGDGKAPEAEQYLWDPEAVRVFKREQQEETERRALTAEIIAEMRRREVDALVPLADSGLRSIKGGGKGGRAGLGTGIDREELRADVAAWWAKHPHLPRKNACRAVLERRLDPNDRSKKKYPIKLSTAVKYTQGLEPPE